jgi:hypothetical protein
VAENETTSPETSVSGENKVLAYTAIAILVTAIAAVIASIFAAA